MNEKLFFEELKKIYENENHLFPWDWENIKKNKNFNLFIAYNLSKNILHGPLPKTIHSRMTLDSDNIWSKRYSEFMLGK